MSLSSYWLPEYQALGSHHSAAKDSSEYLIQLDRVRKGIANFVRIVTGLDIPVRFSTGEHSYGINEKKKKIVVISATNNPAHFDIQCGLALHEGAHFVQSEESHFPESCNWLEMIKWFLSISIREIIPEKTMRAAEQLGISDHDIRMLVKDIANFLEDRRIDRWLYNRAIGYRGYYRAMYEHYFFAEETGRLLRSVATHIPTVSAYRFHMFNIQHPDAHADALPGLREIWEMMNLADVERFGGNRDPKWKTYQDSRAAVTNDALFRKGRRIVTQSVTVGFNYPLVSLPEILRVSVKIAGVIITNAIAQEAINPDDLDNEEVQEYMSEVDPNNLDIPNSGPVDAEEMEAVNKKQEKFLSGDLELEQLSPRMSDLLNALKDSKAEMRSIETDGVIPTVNAIVYHRMTRGFLNSPACKFSRDGQESRQMREAITKGLQMGNLLAHRLQVIRDDSPLTMRRQKHGRIDKRRLSALAYGAEDIFQHTAVEKYAPVELWLTVDASSSMSGKKWSQAMQLAISLAVAGSKVERMRTVIALRGGQFIPEVLIAFDSKTDSLTKIRTLFPFLYPGSSTPEGLCFAATREMVLNMGEPGSRRYFVNVSDGEPAFHIRQAGGFIYYGEPAWNHTRAQVDSISGAGIEVLSYFVTNTPKEKWAEEIATDNEWIAFRRMYGQHAQLVDTESVTQIASTLNKKFLQRG